MASYQSPLDISNQYQSPINLELLNTALKVGQDKYDTGLQNYENNLAQLKVQENLLIRDPDKQRFAQNVQGLIDEVNKGGKMDWSKSGITKRINAYTDSALDDYTLNQIGNSQKIRNFESEVGEIKKKNDGRYNDGNYGYAHYKAGLGDYLKGTDAQGNRVDNIGNLQYKNYTDVEKKLSDQVAELEKLSKDQVIQIPDGRGGMTQTTISNLSPDKVRQIAAASLNTDDQEQIKINGFVSTGGYANTSKINEDVTSTFNAKIAENSQKEDYWKVQKSKGNLSKEKQKEAEEQYNYYSTNATNLNKNKDILLSNKEQAAAYIEQQRLLDGVTSKFATIYNQSTIYKVDEIYQNKIDNARNDAKLQLDYDKFTYTKDKDSGKIEAQNLIFAPKATTGEDIINKEEKIDEQIKQYGTVLNTETAEFKSRLDEKLKQNPNDEDAKAILSLYNANKSKGQSDGDAVRNAVSMTDYDSGALVYIDSEGKPKNYRKSILDVSGKYDTYTMGRANAIKKAEDEHTELTLNTQDAFTAFYKNPNTKMLWRGSDGVERAFSVRDVLIKNKMMKEDGTKIGDIKSRTPVLEALKRSYYADQTLSNVGGNTQYLNPEGLKKLAKSFGESPKDTYTEEVGARGGVIHVPNPNTKTGQFLARAKENKIYDTFVSQGHSTDPGLSINDQSLSSDDRTVGRFVNEDYRKSEVYKNEIDKLYGKTEQNYTIGVTASDKVAHARVGALITSQAVDTSTGKFNKDNTYNISYSSDGQSMIIQQYDNDKKTGTTSFETTVSASNFKQAVPQVANQLDFNLKQAHYTIDRVKPFNLVTQPIKFFTENTDEQTIASYRNDLVSKPQFQPYLIKEDAVIAITSRLTPAFGQGSNESKVVEQAISESSNFSIKGEMALDFNGSPYLTLLMKNKSGDTVYKKLVKNTDDVDNYKTILDNYPQVIYADMVNDIMTSQIQSRISNGGDSNYYTKLISNIQ